MFPLDSPPRAGTRECTKSLETMWASIPASGQGYGKLTHNPTGTQEDSDTWSTGTTVTNARNDGEPHCWQPYLPLVYKWRFRVGGVRMRYSVEDEYIRPSGTSFLPPMYPRGDDDDAGVRPVLRCHHHRTLGMHLRIPFIPRISELVAPDHRAGSTH